MMDLTQNIPEEKEVAIAVTLISDLEKDTQFSQGLQIDADQEEAWVMADFKSGSRFRYISTSLCLVFILTTVKTYYLEFHRTVERI